ncbi:MAG: DUF2298 domain-containing protein [Thermomicrobiales bacterium]
MRKRQRSPRINPRIVSATRSTPQARIAATREPQQEAPLFWLGPIRVGFGLALFVILIFAAIVRFAGIGWGGSYYMHPDERFMTIVTTTISWPGSLANYFDSASSPLNPYNNDQGSFLYGTFPLFLSKLIGTIVGDTVYGNAHMPGRVLAALSDIGTVAMAGWIGRMLFGRLAGLFAATLLAFTALQIQTAHYYSVDSMDVFFITATLAFTLHASRNRSWGGYAVAGLMLGLAAASKPNSIIAAGFLALPVLEQIRLRGWGSLVPRFRTHGRHSRRRDTFPILLATLLAAFIAIWTFRFAQPYAFLGPSPWSFKLDPRWTHDLSYWRQVQSGALDYPPSIQWADRTPILFMVDNMVRWGMAPGFGLTALAALAVAVYRIAFARRWPSWWLTGLTVWCGFHIVFYGIGFVKAQRYLLPAYPVMGVLAGGLLASLVFWAMRNGGIPLPRGRTLRWPRSVPTWLHPGFLLPIVVVIVTMGYGVAFANIYEQPLSRVAASEWIFNNVPAGSMILSEYWDDGLPYCIPGYDCGQYKGVQLHLYDEDSERKLNELIGQLNQTDYVVLSSRRLIDSIGRMPYRWPMTTKYYDYLFNGELGFDLVATFDSPPHLGGLRFDDSHAEESMTVYEHPTVYIFKKSDRWDYHAAWTLLDDALDQGLGDGGGLQIRPVLTSPDVQLLDTADETSYYSKGTWSSISDPSGWTNHWPVLWWYLALQLLTLPAIPLLWRLLPGLPDRGYAVAKTLGLVGVAYIAWLLASLRLLEFGPLPIAVGWLVIAALSLFAVRGRFQDFWSGLRPRWVWLAATEILFVTVFLIAVWIRANNPDLWHQWRGGEKPLDLAFFNATIRTPWFPPYDPWFANGTIHYYYWGLVPWATITRLTGIVPTTAYNLAVPTIFALLLVNVWSVSAAFIARLVQPLRATPGTLRQHLRPILLALSAPILVGVLGNLQLVRLLGQGSWDAPAAPASLPRLGGLTDILWGTATVFVALPDLPSTTYWDPTRVVPGTVNEFPYFSFLFGDLHPHFTAMPMLSALLVIVAAFVFGARAESAGTRAHEIFASLGGWRPALLFAIGGGFLCGALMTSNTWNYPPSLLLLCGAALVISGTYSGWNSAWALLRDVGAFAIVAFAASRIPWQPYIAHYGSLPTSVDPVYEATSLSDFLSINGVLIFAIASYLGLEALRLMRASRSEGTLGAFAAWFGVVVGLGCFALAFAAGNTSLFLGLLIVLVLIVTWYRQYDRAHLLLLGMIGLGLLLLLIPDWLRLMNDIGRMNTLFKLYLHAWILLGTAGSVSIALVFDAFARKSLDDVYAITANEEPENEGDDEPENTVGANEPYPARPHTGWFPRLAEVGWNLALAVLVIGAAAYPALATPARIDDRIASTPVTLDGLAYMDGAEITAGQPNGPQETLSLASDRKAVQWLLEHVDGLPIVLEAHTNEYQWGNRISAMTGLPTVIGWSAQERVHRPDLSPLIMNRINDVNQIYGSLGDFESVRPLLDHYAVRLIYVGGLERAMYGQNALTKFPQAAAQGALTVLYQQDGVTIYEYHPNAPVEPSTPLPPATPATFPQASPESSPVVASPAVREATPEATVTPFGVLTSPLAQRAPWHA